jgi:hypothetical protein
MDPGDFELVLRHAPEFVEDWLEGSIEVTSDFQRRVQLGEGAYLALCEALLRDDARRGVVLWRGLKRAMTTHFTDQAEVDEMIHIALRVPDSPDIAELRAELLGLTRTNTDRDLLDLAIAAECNDKRNWLSGIIAADRAYSSSWRRRRSWILGGFTANNDLPVVDAWPDGEVKTEYEEIRRWSTRSGYKEACSHYWWRAYWAAETASEAYAAWVMLLRSVDRRAWSWMNHDEPAIDNGSRLYRLKVNHPRVNRSELVRTMKKQEEKFDKQFLKRDVVLGVGPWIGPGAI